MSSLDLESFADRPFSFYPPIRNIKHNEWRYQKGTWSEVLVRNTKTGSDIWVPRRYLLEIDHVEEPVMIVGLTAELEYQGGAVWPHKRRVVEMPSAGKRAIPISDRATPAPQPRGSRDSIAEKKISRLIFISVVAFITLSALTVFIIRNREAGGTIAYQSILQQDLKLTASDDYYSVVRALGEPAAVRWKSDTGERQFQALDYPTHGLTVILMGPDRKNQHYIGAKNDEWRTVHSVILPSGTNSASMLRALERF